MRLRGLLSGSQAGFALAWVLLAILGVAAGSMAAMIVARTDALIGESFQFDAVGSYLAQAAIAEYYATYAPADSITDTTVTFETEAATDADDEGDEESDGLEEYTGADPGDRTFSFQHGTVTVAPRKVTESFHGDLYLIEATAQGTDPRPDRPPVLRSVRTFARLVPPFRIRAALMAPNGFTATSSAKHVHLDGKRKGKCGVNTDIPALAVPLGTETLNAKKMHLRPKDSPSVLDTTTNSHRELMDSISINWSEIGDSAYYAGLTNFITVPGNVASLQAVDFGHYSKKGLWPIVLVNGDVSITSNINGFGFLVITGRLSISDAKLNWRGIIVTGQEIVHTGSSHLHMRGAVVTGVNCPNNLLAQGKCRTESSNEGAHFSVKYNACDVEAAWAQLLDMRSLAKTRHTRLF
jgi:hypothetical protein